MSAPARALMGALAIGLWAAACDAPTPPAAVSAAAPSAAAPSAALPQTLGLKGAETTPITVPDLRELPGAGAIWTHPAGYAEGAKFEAVPLTAVLDRAYGDRWRRADALLFTCADGYQPTLPLAVLEGADPWLLWGYDDQRPFEAAFTGKPHPVSLAPFALSWVIGPEADAKALPWPYQITGVELIRVADRFPALQPPKGASAQVELGSAVWRRECMKCHRLNGQGGAVGPELNQPVSVTTYWRPEWLRRWIRAPQTLRAGSPMPPVPLSDGDLDALLAYLTAMAPPPPAP